MEPAVLVSVAVAVVVVAAGSLAALLVTRARRRVLTAALEASTAEVDALRLRVDELTRRLDAERGEDPVTGEAPEFVITSLPDGALRGAAAPHEDDAPVGPGSTGQPLSTGQFASVAVGESVVRLLSLGYGVRRALSAESRNRIRFEARREVKRARRQRRRDLKEAKRHLRTVSTRAEDAA